LLRRVRPDGEGDVTGAVVSRHAGDDAIIALEILG